MTRQRQHPLDPIISAAIDGWDRCDEMSGHTYTFRRPSILSASPKSVVYAVERHWADSTLGRGLPAFDYAVVKVRRPAFKNGRVYTDGPDPIRAEAELRGKLGRLPFMGSLSHRVSMPLDRLKGSFEVATDDELSLLVTPLRRESFGGTAPITLAAALPRYGCYTQRELRNWFDVALALGHALWLIHARGYAHCDIKLENVVLLTDHACWRDINVIDFEHVTPDETLDMRGAPGTMMYFRPERLDGTVQVSCHTREDLYALGVTLLVVLGGQELRDRMLADTTGGTEGTDRYPHELRQWAGKRDEGAPEIRNRAKRLCYRYLLANRGANASDGDTLTILDAFLTEVEKLVIRQHRCRLHTVGGGTREPATASTGDVSLMQLTSLSGLMGREELEDLCRRYVMDLDEAKRVFADESHMPAPEPWLAPSNAVRYGVELLRAGYGRAARSWFQWLLDDHATAFNAAEKIRILRLLVGVLMVRERAYSAACRYVAPHEQSSDPEVRWWARLLRQKLAHHAGAPLPYDVDALRGPPDHRARLWLRVTKALPVLRSGVVASDTAPRLRGAMSAAQSAYETSFAALCMARAYASATTLADWQHAIPTLVMAAGHAVTGRLPYEYAASLCVAAKIVCDAFDQPELARALHEQGFDTEEALVIAGRCAALAAEILQRLDAPYLKAVALVQAAEAYLRCPSLERRTEGLRYLSLAESNRSLHGVNRAGPSGLGMGMPVAIERWRQVARDHDRSVVADDPGAVLAYHFYGRYGSVLLALWDEQGGLAVELPGTGEHDDDVTFDTNDLAPVVSSAEAGIEFGAATARLMREWHRWRGSESADLRLLDVGCGMGADTATLLAREPGIESALGIDISEWHIQTARARCGGLPRLAFERLDFNEVGQRYPNEFHLALARDSLYHATDRAVALRSIRQSLRPGGYLLATDWVQIRAALPAEMRRLASTVWLTSVQSLANYGALLRETGFECQWYQLEGTAMSDYFRAAEVRARKKLDQLPACAASEQYMRVRDIFCTLTEMSDPRDGIFSWLFYVARAV